jgi:hypothetical protein
VNKMRRTGFKPKPRKPLKRTPFKRATKSHTSLRVKSKRKIASRGYVVPKWFNRIKLGSHGNTPAQKRYWKVVSDTYRKADWEQYGGKCVSCPSILENWQDGQLAHYKAWSVCNAWFKFERKNLGLSCPNCNRLSDGVIGNRFAKELQRRHGEHILDWIETTNECFRGQKMEVWEIVDKVANLRPDLVEREYEHSK